MKSDKLYILCIEQKKYDQTSALSYNEFNIYIIKNGYYIHELKKNSKISDPHRLVLNLLDKKIKKD